MVTLGDSVYNTLVSVLRPFGHSDWPEPNTFAYTFDHCADVMNHFTKSLGLARYTLAHPERIVGLIVQNAVAHNEGLGPLWRSPHRSEPLSALDFHALPSLASCSATVLMASGMTSSRSFGIRCPLTSENP
jgi:hypothetical protein